MEPEEARLSLDASDPGAVLVVEDVRERFGGRVVAFDRVTAAGATVRSVDGRLVYEPADDFVGVDRFRVRVDRGRYQLEVVVTVSVSRPGDAAARAARRDGGGNDIIDGSVIDRSSGDVAGTAGVGDAAAGELALTEDRMPSRPATLFALLLLIVLCFGMATTARD